MQKKRKEIESLLEDNESVEDNIHPDRRKSKIEQEQDERKHNKKKNKVEVWVKKETVEYEEELQKLQIESTR